MSSFTQRLPESFPSPKTRPMQSGLPLFVSQLVSMGVWLSVCFCPVLLLFLLQLVVSFCRCWTSQLSHRFKHTSILRQLMCLEWLTSWSSRRWPLTGRWRWRAGLRWQAGSWMKSDHSLAQGWCPQMSQAPQNWRTASLWCDSFHLWCDFFSLFDPAGIKYKICRNLQISFSLFHPAGIKYKFADFISK